MRTTERRLLAALGAAVLVYFVFIATNQSPYSIEDDAFIAFRYSQNLAAGRGLVFNPGERIWGFTSPLFVLLLGAIATIGVAPPAAAIGLSLLAQAATSLLWWDILRGRISLGARAVLVLLIATMSSPLFFIGMETTTLIFFLSLMIFFLEREQSRAGALAGALACLTRPDAILLCAPLLWFSPSRRDIKTWLFFFLPGAAWLVFATLYFGSVLPNSFYAKKGSTSFLQFVRESYEVFAAWGFPASGTRAIPWYVYLAPVLAPLALGARGLRTPRFFAALIVFPWTLFFSYALIGAKIGQRWEYFAGSFFLYLSIALGAIVFIEKAIARSSGVTRRVLSAVLLAVGLLLAGSQAASTIEIIDSAKTSYWKGGRHDAYREIADWLKENLSPTHPLIVGEPGTLAYYSDLPLFDFERIISRSATVPRFDYVLAWGDFAEFTFEGRKVRRVHYFPKKGYWDFSLMECAEQCEASP